MLNGSKTGNLQSVIPSVLAQHSGEYTCMHHLSALHVYSIYSCICYPAINIRISKAKAALLKCAPRPKDVEDSQTLTRWYRKRPTESEAPIVDSWNKSVLLPLALTDTLSVSDPHLTMLTLIVTAEDVGVFRCRVWASYPQNFGHEQITNPQNDNITHCTSTPH